MRALHVPLASAVPAEAMPARQVDTFTNQGHDHHVCLPTGSKYPNSRVLGPQIHTLIGP